MMELRYLKDVELNEKIKTLAAQERKLTEMVVRHIAEVDRRKLFLRKAYASLFEYLVKEIGYSQGAAQRRIDAARLVQAIPEVARQIETGAIHLSQISKLQRVCRQVKKDSGKVVSSAVQQRILQKIENQNNERTDLILAQEFQLAITTAERRVTQRDESVRIELTFTKDEMALLKTAQDILSNKTGGSLKSTILETANRTATVAVKLHGKRDTREAGSVALKSLTPKLKRQVLDRDQSCQFKDLNTGRICGARRFLEIDHIVPRFAGGTNSADNLRVLCKNHNLYRYQQRLL